jgi:hypothetical protein
MKRDVSPTDSTVCCIDKKAIQRTTSQVLNIVHAGGFSKGGFYPDGMNGMITAQS